MENGRDGVYGALVRLLATKRGSLTRAVKNEPGTVMAKIVLATTRKGETASRRDVVSVSPLKPHFNLLTRQPLMLHTRNGRIGVRAAKLVDLG